VKRGDLYRVRRPPGDRKPARVFVVVSRQTLVDARFSTVVCAPVYSQRHGLSTEVAVGPSEGLKHDSSIACDGLVSLRKGQLTDYVGSLSGPLLRSLGQALRIALAVEDA
jgi:mRNA interferase MazF